MLALLSLFNAHADGLVWTPHSEGPAPLSLTAADGTGLALSDLRVEAVVQGPLAYTELHLTFDNPQGRTIEGRFEITLPEDAAISRFAMKLGDHWQEGEVVEREAAVRAYEDFLHQRTDPALLEYDAGNTFRARVFPIPANSTKELKISWSHDLEVGEGWSLPTGGLPELGYLSADVWVEGEHYRMETEHSVPEGDLGLPSVGEESVALRGEETSVLRFLPELSVGKTPVRDAVVLVDTSASRALSFPRILQDLADVVPTFKGNVRVLAYDQEVVPIYDGPARAFGPDALKKLSDRGALGASDPIRALGDLRGGRVILFTDGVRTIGEPDQELLSTLRERGFDRIDAVIRGGARDLSEVSTWVQAGRDDGTVLDADAIGSEDVARRLGLGTAGRMEVVVPGATWVQPAVVSGLQPGDSVTVYADVPRSAPLSVTFGDQAVAMKSTDADGPLLTRASAQAEIQALLAQKTGASEARRSALIEEIVEISKKNRVLSPHTALLVLETEADYERFDIPRNALTDILTIEGGDLAWHQRGDWVLSGNQSAKAPADADRERVVQQSPAKRKLEVSGEVAGSLAPMAPPPPPAAAAPAQRRGRARRAEEEMRMDDSEYDEAPDAEPPSTKPEDAWEGDYRRAMELLIAGKANEAESFARDWRARSPGDPLALLALGAALEAQDADTEAARVYGSLIDLFPSRADLRRLAGERLDALGSVGRSLAIDTYRRAVEQRPDHPSGHRQLAWALAEDGRHEEAIDVIRDALGQPFGRFEAAHRILREDATVISRAWARTEPASQVDDATKDLDLSDVPPSGVRFVLNWETDANDVDFHIVDAQNNHAYYSDRELATGGTLYADITTGYGPECFSIAAPEAYPYTMQAHYYSRGPMGFGMGTLQIIEHDDTGRFAIQHHPFVVMTDGAYVPLATLEAPLL